MRYRFGATMVVATVSAMLAGCRDHPAVGTPVADAGHATAIVRDAAGATVGRATASDVAGGLRVTLDARGLPAGTHGVHIHTTGSCDAPGFATAGGHWNPTDRHHGSMNPAGPHQGDLPNMIVGRDGRGTIGAVIAGATLAGMLDSDGAALIIHAGPDDLMSDPAGNSGGRIACGVFARG